MIIKSYDCYQGKHKIGYNDFAFFPRERMPNSDVSGVLAFHCYNCEEVVLKKGVDDLSMSELSILEEFLLKEEHGN